MAQTTNAKPSFLGHVTTKCYDGVSDDLLTARLGKTGLAGAAPGFVDPLAPTAAELRKHARSLHAARSGLTRPIGRGIHVELEGLERLPMALQR